MGEVMWPMRPAWKHFFFCSFVIFFPWWPRLWQKQIHVFLIYLSSYLDTELLFYFPKVYSSGLLRGHPSLSVTCFAFFFPSQSTVLEVIHNHLWLWSMYFGPGRKCSSSPAWLNFHDSFWGQILLSVRKELQCAKEIKDIKISGFVKTMKYTLVHSTHGRDAFFKISCVSKATDFLIKLSSCHLNAVALLFWLILIHKLNEMDLIISRPHNLIGKKMTDSE